MRRAEQAVAPPDPAQPRLPDIIARIKDCYPGLSRAEQSVADAVLSDVQAAVDASNAELAIRAGVSQPSVTRFCRSIGCDGVRDFKLQLARSLVVGEIFLASDNPRAAAVPGILPPFWASVMGEARLALREVERQLDPALVLAAAYLVIVIWAVLLVAERAGWHNPAPLSFGLVILEATPVHLHMVVQFHHSHPQRPHLKRRLETECHLLEVLPMFPVLHHGVLLAVQAR